MKAGRAEIRVSYEVAARFGPPVVVMSPKPENGVRTWTVRGKLKDQSKFLMQHTDLSKMSLRFAVGPDWWVFNEVTEVHVGEPNQQGYRHVRVRAIGKEEILYGSA